MDLITYDKIEDYYMENKKESQVESFKAKQVFGSDDSSEAVDEEFITCLRFDSTGEYLSLGDSEGRIIIFKANRDEQQVNYEYFAEFQSHYRKLDLLNGRREIMEGIVDICWMNPQGDYLKMFTTNSKTIRFWKCHEKAQKKLLKAPNKENFLPKFTTENPSFIAKELKAFPSLHEADINSMSKSYNEQFLLSSDQTKCFIWDIQKSQKPFVTYDITNKKSVINDLEMTCSKMHPKSDTIFVAGMNQNCLALSDLRQSNVIGNGVQFGVDVHSVKNFFTDMVSSIGSVEFTKNGKYLISREYLSVKVWDLTQTRKPILNICVQNSLKRKLAQLFQKNNIHDKFSISSTPDSGRVITGNYNNTFHLIDLENGQNIQYEPSFENKTIKREILRGQDQSFSKFNTQRRVRSGIFHPDGRSFAVSSLNSFFLYSL